MYGNEVCAEKNSNKNIPHKIINSLGGIQGVGAF